ncbi:histidine kinase [Aquabacter sp. CN5-332]|uniref:sensor histidine kinase n=1 Tax=Aquabacter sp. CN5-332 TaxID=3156608 RepID=UPI0032B601A7
MQAPLKEKVRAWWHGLPLFWQAQIIGWGLFAVVDLVNRQLTYHSFPIALAITVMVCPVLVLLSTGLRAVYARTIPGTRLSTASLAIIVAFSTASAVVVVSVVAGIRQVSGWSIPLWHPFDEVAVPLIHYSFVLSGWSICYFWMRAELDRRADHQRTMVAEAEALRAEIQQLRMQLDPHFLFNALNGVAEEIPEHPHAALAMMRDLTDYLRHSLAGIDTPVVPVHAEVASLAAYLRIQEARFGKKLRTHLHTDHAASMRPIANFLLQPLVENAVKHGARGGHLEVGINIALVANALKVVIVNTGTLDGATGRRRGRGIGLKNVRRRLDVHYPGRHTFTLSEAGGDAEHPSESRVVATLVLEGEPCSGS